MFALAWFTVRQVLLQRRAVVTYLLLAGPLAVVVLIRCLSGHYADIQGRAAAWAIYHETILFASFMVVLPLVCMLCGTSLIGSEVDNRTLVYLITRRMRRITVLLTRYVAAAVTLSVLFAAVLLLQHMVTVMGVDPDRLQSPSYEHTWKPAQDLGHYLLVLPVGVFVYLAIFALISLLTRKPLSASILYIFAIELVAGNMPFGISRLSVVHHLRREVFERMPLVSGRLELPRELLEEVYPAGVSGDGNLMIAVGVMLVLSCALITLRELVAVRVTKD